VVEKENDRELLVARGDEERACSDDESTVGSVDVVVRSLLRGIECESMLSVVVVFFPSPQNPLLAIVVGNNRGG